MAEAKIAGSYGVDAPRVPVVSAIGGVALVLYGILGGNGLGVVLGVLLFGQAGLYLHTANRGRFVLWARILGDAALEGDERVLDVGCGRGLVAVTAARLVPDGQVVALDQWRDQARTGVGPDLARSNAKANGVEDRVDVVTGDPTAIDAKRGSFDLVVSNLPFQLVRDREQRASTLAEMFRVVRPGGRILIVEIQHAKQCKQELTELGASDVTVTPLGWEGWYGNPFYASKLVSATR